MIQNFQNSGFFGPKFSTFFWQKLSIFLTENEILFIAKIFKISNHELKCDIISFESWDSMSNFLQEIWKLQSIILYFSWISNATFRHLEVNDTFSDLKTQFRNIVIYFLENFRAKILTLKWKIFERKKICNTLDRKISLPKKAYLKNVFFTKLISCHINFAKCCIEKRDDAKITSADTAFLSWRAGDFGQDLCIWKKSASASATERASTSLCKKSGDFVEDFDIRRKPASASAAESASTAITRIVFSLRTLIELKTDQHCFRESAAKTASLQPPK